MRFFYCLRFLAAITLTSIAATSFAEIVVHETFSDGNIADDSPARWSLKCFQADCDPDSPTLEYSIENGEFVSRYTNFWMFSLDSVAGVEVRPRNQWSIRARVLPIKQEQDSGSIAGVGLDEYYWAASVGADFLLEDTIAAGRFAAQSNSLGVLPFFEEWVVQLDVYPDHLEGYRWLVRDPGTVLDVAWDPGEEIIPSHPVFWANFTGVSKFREVIVDTEAMGPGGDFDRDGSLTTKDVNQLSQVIRTAAKEPRYNLTSDHNVDKNDLEAWVHRAKKTYFGDANLDGQFDSGDLIVVFQAGVYEDMVSGNAGWQHGDWNGDGEFDSGDLITAFQDGGYDKGPRRAAVSAVPEPASVLLVYFGLLGGLVLRLNHGRSCRFLSSDT
jgi:hypothetical protein